MDWDDAVGAATAGFHLEAARIGRRLVAPAISFYMFRKENEAMEELWGGRRGWLGVDMKKEFLVCFYGKASVNVSRLPAHRSGPPRLTDSSGFHQGRKDVYGRLQTDARTEADLSGREPAERQQNPGCVASVSLSQTHTCPSGLGAIKPPGPSESRLPVSVHPCSSLLFQ